jgi:hypothetical protein
VVERRRRPRFTTEAFERLTVLGEFIGQKLNRDKAIELVVFGLLNHPHGATAQLAQDSIVRDGVPDHCCESYSGKTAHVNECLEVPIGETRD